MRADAFVHAPRTVITEVLWAGSDVSSSDEWIGVGCFGAAEACDIGGWTATSVNGAGAEVVVATFPAGTSIPVGMEAIISRMTRESSRIDIDPLLVSPDLTLPNTKLLLRLRDASGSVVDLADDGTGSPFGGANPTGGIGRASMQRIDFFLSGSDAANWRTANASLGFDAGAQVMGSPGHLEAAEAAEVSVDAAAALASSAASTSSASCTPLVPDIAIQSGSPRGIGKVTINVQAVAREGQLTGASCRWEYPDGWKSESCNPPVRTIKTEGSSYIRLSVTDACGNLATRDLPVDVVSPSEEEIAQGCMPTAFTGIIVSELSPAGDEWIELENRSGMERILCGWSVDDGEGGSAPFLLDAQRIPDGGLLLLSRKLSGITLNDDGDSARLFAPAVRGQSGGLVDAIAYEDIEEGHVLARRTNGVWLWTPYATPEGTNRFRDPLSVSGRSSLAITAALPNPAGIDDGNEWIEITNIGGRPALLRGMSLIVRSPSGSENRVVLPTDAALSRLEVLALHGDEIDLRLPNDGGTVVLADPDGNALSALSWDRTDDDVVVRAPADASAQIRVEAISVIDGDTIDVRVIDARGALRDGLFPEIFRVRLLGIDALEVGAAGSEQAAATLEFLLAGRPLRLRFDRQLQDEDGRYLAYIEDDETREDIGRLMLRRGLAAVMTAYPFARSDDYRAVEQDARGDTVGIWSTPQRGEILKSRETADVLRAVVRSGFAIHADPPPGIVASGTILRLRTNLDAALFVSVNSGAYQLSVGELVIDASAVVRAYAIASGVQPSCGTLTTPIWEGAYNVYASVGQPVVINEIHPMPIFGESEWIEIVTTGESAVDLGGWMLDDANEGGSRPWRIPAGTILDPKEPLVLRKDQTHLTLNDGGDEVWLLKPDGGVADHAVYAPLKRGESWTPECVTASPTPRGENRCTSVADFPLKKGLKKVSRPRKNVHALSVPDIAWADPVSFAVGDEPLSARGALTLAILLLALSSQGAALWVVRTGGTA